MGGIRLSGHQGVGIRLPGYKDNRLPSEMAKFVCRLSVALLVSSIVIRSTQPTRAAQPQPDILSLVAGFSDRQRSEDRNLLSGFKDDVQGGPVEGLIFSDEQVQSTILQE